MEKVAELEHVALDLGDFYKEPMTLTLQFTVLENAPVLEALWTPPSHGCVCRWLDDDTKERVLALIAVTGANAPLPKPVKVIFNDPATIVFWADGKKTVAKAHEGDDYDPIMGALICAYRKVTMNRRSVDAFEFTANELAGLRCTSNLRAVAQVLVTDADLDAVLSECLYELSLLNADDRGTVADTAMVAADILELGEV